MMYMYMYMCEGRVNLIIGMDAASSFHLYVVHMMNFTTLSHFSAFKTGRGLGIYEAKHLPLTIGPLGLDEVQSPPLAPS